MFETNRSLRDCLRSHLIRREKSVAADDAKELLCADAAPAVQVELVEEVLDNQAGVTNIAPHLFQHVGLFHRPGISIQTASSSTTSVFRNPTRAVLDAPNTAVRE